VFDWKLAGIHEKTGLTGGLSRAPYARVWRGVRGPSLPPEKMNLGLAEMQFPAIKRGFLARFLQSLVSRYSITFSIPNHRHPTLTTSMQIWIHHENRILKKWRLRTARPQTPVAPPVRQNTLHRAVSLRQHGFLVCCRWFRAVAVPRRLRALYGQQAVYS